MMLQEKETVDLAGVLIEQLARGLNRDFARLYSQHTRLRSGEAGLSSWSKEESTHRLEDAVRLLEAAFIRRKAGEDDWKDGARRCGELLEWLSHSILNPESVPLDLLAAAVYQIAGYPARASGLLANKLLEGESTILTALLKADFNQLFKAIVYVWSNEISPSIKNQSEETFSVDFYEHRLIKEIISSLGILCVNQRWGADHRIERAIEKLEAAGKLFLHGESPYSWLLAKMCAEVASIYVNTSMRYQLASFIREFNSVGKQAMERYFRLNYLAGKTLAWPSQIRGIQKLQTKESFAFCTPTGSGKTAIAELGILQSLFLSLKQEELSSSSPLAIYMVPSRALAAEVESKLNRVLYHLGVERPIRVTGLYGGIDWGPTDTWLNTSDPTVLICTYEKAEALIRFLGPLFLNRVSIVIIDEAHTVQFVGGDINADNRALRLEILGSRLFAALEEKQARIIALSAVSHGGEDTLARWVTGKETATAEKIPYRSNRQLIGRLECLPNRRFEIHYDLLDGARLAFREKEQSRTLNTPYIPNPFPAFPPSKKYEADSANPSQRIYPYVLWAALQLASKDEKGHHSPVLISLTERPENYCSAFLQLLENEWSNQQLPIFFDLPYDEAKEALWRKSLVSCEDYFSRESYEYKLLNRGIVLHHGKMPGLLARLLVDLVEKKIVNIVIATSTLSEGVNLPFETILIPSLKRWNGDLSEQEFANLVGRAGRPGYGTEGRSLVVIPSYGENRAVVSKRQLYTKLLYTLSQHDEHRPNDDNVGSALAGLIGKLEECWRLLSKSSKISDFHHWLEMTIPPTEKFDDEDTSESEAFQMLDALDSFILSALVEIESLAGKEMSPDQLEEQLIRIWRRTYARVLKGEEERLKQVFLVRGRSLRTNIYPDPNERRQLYRTSLPPNLGKRLIDQYPIVKQHLQSGFDYSTWNRSQQFWFIADTVNIISTLPKFEIKDPANASWTDILLWWLAPDLANKNPTISKISQWHKFISQSIIYKFNWGLSSILALAIDEANNGKLEEASFEKWPKTGLPWSVFWLKELTTWGTLDPVAAYILSKGLVVTRKSAEKIAEGYYIAETSYQMSIDLPTPNDHLNPTAIRDWVDNQAGQLIEQKNLQSRQII